MSQRVLAVFGTRPEVIKLAPVIHDLRRRPDEARLVLCSTGQHREMLAQTLAAFELRPDIELGVMRFDQHPTELLGRLLIALRPVLADLRPDTIVVQGDTTSVLAGALAGFLYGVRVAHVEAGLRTRDKRAPFPEEVNRRLAGVLADDHFAPTVRARDNLLAEGVLPERVFLTGNTVVDALRWMHARVAERRLPPELDPGASRLILVTAHRRESFGQPFRDLCAALRDIAERFRDVRLIYPVHLNPHVHKTAHEVLNGCPRVQLIEPVDYALFVGLLARAHLVLTDSGGIQEEAPALGKPVLVLRDKTERPEAAAAGVVRVVGTDRERIVDETARLLTDADAYRAMSRVVDVYGDGNASRRIAEVVLTGQMTTPPFAPPIASAE